jgi:hypothetical protein
MRESRTYGFVRGAPRDRCPYRDPYIIHLSPATSLLFVIPGKAAPSQIF